MKGEGCRYVCKERSQTDSWYRLMLGVSLIDSPGRSCSGVS